MKFVKVVFIAVAVTSAVGCANVTVPPPQPDLKNVTAARQLSSPVKVGDFKVAAGVGQAGDKVVSVRGSNNLNAPGGQGFSGYLREVLIADLRAANKLDPASPITIAGELTKSELDAGMSTGTATIAARFLVSRPEGVCFNKELTASDRWESSVMAAVAVPLAFNHYTALYPELTRKLLTDDEFRQRCGVR